MEIRGPSIVSNLEEVENHNAPAAPRRGIGGQKIERYGGGFEIRSQEKLVNRGRR